VYAYPRINLGCEHTAPLVAMVDVGTGPPLLLPNMLAVKLSLVVQRVCYTFTDKPGAGALVQVEFCLMFLLFVIL
jgi:hypothetical protein